MAALRPPFLETGYPRLHCIRSRQHPRRGILTEPEFSEIERGLEQIAEELDDLQESVELVLDYIKTVGDSIQIAAGVLSTLTVHPEKMAVALALEMLATEFAYYLVYKGVPFREVHHILGCVVALAEQNNVRMDTLTLEQLQAIDSWFGLDVQECLDYERAVELKDAIGGTSKHAVREQIGALKAIIAGKSA